MSNDIEYLVHDIQMNLQRVIKLADEISQEYRRTIHVDMRTKKSGRNVKLLRELLETDNLIRDTIAQLRKATSTISFNTDKNDLLRDEEFLANLYDNLTQMFKSFEKIYEVMEFDQVKIDNLVIETIDSLDRLSHM